MDDPSQLVNAKVLSAVIRASKPTFKSSSDRIAFVAHAFMLCNGFTLVGLASDGEDIPSPDAPEASIDGWNNSQELYVFKYVDSSGTKDPIIVKCLTMGNIMVINAAKLIKEGENEEENPCSLDIKISDYINSSIGIIQGYNDLNGLVNKLCQTFKVLTTEKESIKHSLREMPKVPEYVQPDIPQYKTRNMDPVVPPPIFDRNVGMIGGPSDLLMGGVGLGGVGSGINGSGNGMHVGLDDPMFNRMLLHPELQQPNYNRLRYDPIAPPGVPGYMPNDFIRRPPGHEDLMDPPDPSRPYRGNFNNDSMFG